MSTANININLDSKKANQSLKDLNKSVQENGKSTESLRLQLRKLTQELQTLEPGTQRFKELTIQTGELRDRIKDTTDIINAAAGSPMENLGKGLANTTEIGIKGFQGIAGAMALVTGNDQQLQELFFRLQALQGVVQSIQYFGQLGDTINQIKANFAAFGQSVSGSTGALNAATEAGANYLETAADVVSATADTATVSKIAGIAQNKNAESIAKTTDALSGQLDALNKVTDAQEAASIARDNTAQSVKKEIDAIISSTEKTGDGLRYTKVQEILSDASVELEQSKTNETKVLIENAKAFKDNADAIDIAEKAQKSLNSYSEKSIKLAELKKKDTEDTIAARLKAQELLKDETKSEEERWKAFQKSLEQSNEANVRRSAEIKSLNEQQNAEEAVMKAQQERFKNLVAVEEQKAIEKLTEQYQINGKVVSENATKVKDAALSELDSITKSTEALKNNKKYTAEAAVAAGEIARAREAVVEISQSELKIQSLLQQLDAAKLKGDAKKIKALGEEITAHNLNLIAKQKEIVLSEATSLAVKKEAEATLFLSNAKKVAYGALIVGVLAAAAYAYYKYTEAQEATAKEEEKRIKLLKQQKELQKETSEYIGKEAGEYVSLVYALKNTNAQSEERTKLIKEINSTYGTTLKNMSDEVAFQEQLNTSVREYIALEYNRFKLKKNQEYFNKQLELQFDAEQKRNKLFAAGERERADLIGVTTTRWNAALNANEQFTITEQNVLQYWIEKFENGVQYNELTKKIQNSQNALNALGLRKEQLLKVDDDLTKSGTRYVKQTKDNTDATNDIKIAFEESTKALIAYQEALNADAAKPLELTQYETEVQKLTNGLKALETKRVAAYEEEKKNAEGLYKDKQITKEAYDAKLVKAEDTFEKERLAINQLYADKRVEFDKNWTEEQLLISKKAIADKEKITAQSQLDELARERDLQLKIISASKDTEVKKGQETLKVKQDYFDKSYELILKRRDAELVALEMQYKTDLSNINLNAEQKEQITAQYEANKVKLNADANSQIITAEMEVTDSIKAELETRKEALNEFKSAYDDTASSLADALTTAISGDLDSVGSNFKAFTDALINEATKFDEIGKKWDDLDLKGKVAAVSEAATQAASIATQAVGALYQRQSEEVATATQERYATEDRELAESLENKLISQEEYDSTIKRNEYTRATEEKQARRESFEQQKKLSRANAVIGVSNAVIQALATLPPPFSYVTAGISAGMGAAELAIIDKQKFRAARGGVVQGNGSPTIDSVDALLAPGEMVINARSASMFPSLLSNINMAGGGIPLAPQVPVQPQVTQSVFTKPNEVRAYVVESDISSSQRRVSRLERNGSF